MNEQDWKDYIGYLTYEITKQKKHLSHNEGNVKIAFICNLNIHNMELQKEGALKRIR